MDRACTLNQSNSVLHLKTKVAKIQQSLTGHGTCQDAPTF
jgi:hypothetical protein